MMQSRETLIQYIQSLFDQNDLHITETLCSTDWLDNKEFMDAMSHSIEAVAERKMN